jgi:uncharacterized protein (TIGR02145 family)
VINMKTKFFRKNAPVKAGANVKVASSSYLVLAMTVLLCLPVVLTAQNGVKVSNLNVNAGTVTFNVSWDKNAPELQNIVWVDSVWVFVDYNKGGVMERLPLSAGATLTETSAPEVAHVIQYSDNEKGVWVVGNAKSAGSFSAKVQLLTTEKVVVGACVYTSNYPPVGEYTDNTHISFTGTPMYKIVAEEMASGTTYTTYSDGSYTILTGYLMRSFTDATGAPGKLPCHPAYITFVPPDDYIPCEIVATATWTMTDPRDNREYTVRRMPNNTVWMTQYLDFGDRCLTHSTICSSTTTVNNYVNTSGTYYGRCARSSAYSYTFYDSQAAYNSPGAYHPGPLPSGCDDPELDGYYLQGICPVGWHLPTLQETTNTINSWGGIDIFASALFPFSITLPCCACAHFVKKSAWIRLCGTPPDWWPVLTDSMEWTSLEGQFMLPVLCVKDL